MKDHMNNQKERDVDEKRPLIKSIKKIARKLPKLWQSKDADFKNMFMGTGIFFFLSCLCVLYLFMASNGNDFIDIVAKTVFAYLAFLLFSVSAAMLVWGFYVNNSCRILKNAGRIFLLLLLIISTWTILVGIPALIVYFIFEKIIETRAKKVDNFFNFLLVLAILLLAFIFLLSPNMSLSIWVINKVSILLASKVQINVFSCILFLLITLCVVESFLECAVLLLILKHRQNKNKKEQLKNIKNHHEEDNGTQNNGSEEFIKDEIENEEDEEKRLDMTNKRDREYLWNGIKRIWLIILVVGFSAVTFNLLNIEGIENYSSDIINVLTIYTLFLLYSDKRKEWK